MSLSNWTDRGIMSIEQQIREIAKGINYINEYDKNISFSVDGDIGFIIINNKKENIKIGDFDLINSWISGYLYAKNVKFK